MQNIFDEIDLLIFAAGEGVRLRPITLITPKPLVVVKNKPFLYYQIQQFALVGAKEIVVATSYLKESFPSFARETERELNLKISLTTTEKVSGHGGALKSAGKLLNKEFTLATNGDTYLKPNLGLIQKAIEILKKEKDCEMIVFTFNSEKNPLRIGNKGKLIATGDITYTNEEWLKQADNLGVILFKNTILNYIEASDEFLGIFGNDDLVQRIYKNNKYVHTEEWINPIRLEITMPADLDACNALEDSAFYKQLGIIHE